MNQFTIRLSGPIEDVFSLSDVVALAHAGANRAADKADRLTNGEWSEKAYTFLSVYAKYHDTFQCSQVREAAMGIVPEHPRMDKRAWGSVLIRAQKAGLIGAIGYAPTANRTSHGRQEQQWQLSNK